MPNLYLDPLTVRDIDTAVGKILRDLDNPEPPLRLEPVRELLRLDRQYYSSTETGVLQETVHRLRVAGQQLIQRPTLAVIHRRTFEDKVRERTNRQIEPYDLRRCFSRWMESAGVPRIRRKMYMGHAVGDVTELYERHEVEAYLVADAAKVRAWLGMPEPAAAPLRLEKAE